MSPPEPLGAPRDGEGPVFAEPWEAQAFALAVQLHASGAFAWSEWAEALSEELKRAGADEPDGGSRYYEHWLATLEGLVVRRGLTSEAALDDCKAAWAAAYRATPHGRPVEPPKRR